jgi:lon-related putative ATP-dependent protease
MNETARLAPAQLRQCCDPSALAFATTDELEELDAIFGQQRAKDAATFGIGIRREGYNLYVLGPSGAGKQALLRRLVGQEAAGEPAPNDWCYVHNFDQPHQPKALRLPPGRGTKFRDDMRVLVDELLAAIPAAFDSDEYRARTEQIGAEFTERHEKAFRELAELASSQGIALLRLPTGFSFAPVKKDGEVLSPEEFAQLPDEERQRIEKTVADLQERLAQLLRNAQRSRKDQRERIRKLNSEVASYAVGVLTDEIRQRYVDLPEVCTYLAAVERDLIESVDDIRRAAESQPGGAAAPAEVEPATFRRYQVNLLLAHGDQDGAPVIFEDHPTYQNLLGRVEHVPQFGTLVTDFTLIKPGALHRANGGYLLLDAYKLLAQPFAWEGLKRALTTRTIRIESLGQMYSLVSTISLEPQAIPLTIKVVLFGERFWYHLLYALDPDFRELFKVAVDFDDEVPRTAENQQYLARLIATIARRNALLPFDRTAVARVVEHCARVVEDNERLSTHMQSLVDLLVEADFGARRDGGSVVRAPDVDATIKAQIHRASRISEQMQDAILRDTVLIDTDGAKVGQVNGLSVFALGPHAFAKPTRITASSRVGDGEVIDVQREVKLGGPIHSKGVLILASYLAWRFSATRPHSLRASLVFEQTYGEVEGDSASAAELCALLSSLAGAPIRQALAITGSVNQYGELQAIGAVNEKVEGFFDICKARGLTGDHGVVIPASNVKNLMLREDVVTAAAEGKFHVYAVRVIDEAIELLTGLPAGERLASGDFPEGSINREVAARLRAFSATRQAFGAVPGAPKWKGMARRRRG